MNRNVRKNCFPIIFIANARFDELCHITPTSHTIERTAEYADVVARIVHCWEYAICMGALLIFVTWHCSIYSSSASAS